MLDRKVLEILIRARDEASKTLNRASNIGRKAFGALATAAKYAALAVGAGIVGAVAMGVKALEEQEVVLAKTGAVIKSTGGAAGVTAEQVNEMANSLMEKSGVDDMAIQSGENLLLTFTNIQNKAGEGNDIFNQATSTMLDMSVALGQDMKSSAIQLGKALNDPIKGVSALQRVGVSFTQEQKKQIDAMVKSGDAMGAQKLILAELNREFGGAAEAVGQTFQGRLAVLKEKFEDLTISIAEKLMPAAMKLIRWATEQMPKVEVALNKFKDWFDENRPALEEAARSLAGVLSQIWKNVRPIVKWFGQLVLDHPKIAGALGGLTLAAWGLDKALKSVRLSLIGVMKLPIVRRLTLIGTVVLAAWEAGKKLAEHFDGPLKASLAALLGPVATLAAHIDEIKYAWQRVQQAAMDAMRWMKEAVGIKNLPAPGHGISGKKFTPIPRMAAGGIVTRPTFAIIGEAGPEAVVPLSKAKGSSSAFGNNLIIQGDININANSRVEGQAAADGFAERMAELGWTTNAFRRTTNG